MTKLCPNCSGVVVPVTYKSDSQYSPDQFEKIKPGDFWCLRCPSNGRGHSGKCYWWLSEIEAGAVNDNQGVPLPDRNKPVKFANSLANYRKSKPC